MIENTDNDSSKERKKQKFILKWELHRSLLIFFFYHLADFLAATMDLNISGMQNCPNSTKISLFFSAPFPFTSIWNWNTIFKSILLVWVRFIVVISHDNSFLQVADKTVIKEVNVTVTVISFQVDCPSVPWDC